MNKQAKKRHTAQGQNKKYIPAAKGKAAAG